jgi:hypothetical protein
MVGDAKRQANHRGDASPCPELALEAIRFGALLQQYREVGAWPVGQPGWGTEGRPMAKRFRSSVAGAFYPLTDGSFADAEGFGDLVLGPALLFEAPGIEPSSFSPIVGCTVHAWAYSTDSSRALDYYTRVSNTQNQTKCRFYENEPPSSESSNESHTECHQ